MTIVQASLMPGSGDGLLSYDTQTGLEWLNLTATLNQSYLVIQAGFGGFLGSLGFKFAPVDQVITLYKHAGINKLGGPTPVIDPVNDTGVEVLLDLMGGQALKSPVEYAQGMVNSGTLTDRRAPVNLAGIFLNRSTSPANAYADSGYRSWRADDRAPDVAAYLVRKRPEPRTSIKKKERQPL